MHDVYAVKRLSRLRLNFSHLNEFKVGHEFKDETHWDWDSAIETTLHFLLQYQQNQIIRFELFKSICNIDPKIRNLFNGKLLHSLLKGSE